MKEEWRDVKGYEGLYQVSSLGRIKSLTRFRPETLRREREKHERILKPTRAVDGYIVYSLCNKDIEIRQMKGHRLTAIAFIPNPENKPQVNHKNGKKDDNRVSNLEWSTSSENRRHALQHGLIIPIKGENHHAAKFTVADVREIRRTFRSKKIYGARGSNVRELANKFGVTIGTIRMIVKKKSWRDV